MVSELVDGESLREVIERGPVALRKLLDMAVQLADGLAAAHAAAIVHRDLKPDNLMLTREGRLKILDFGLAKQTAIAAQSDADATVTVLKTQAGVILGTVELYEPGAGARRARWISAPTSSRFGLILYELLTGQEGVPAGHGGGDDGCDPARRAAGPEYAAGDRAAAAALGDRALPGQRPGGALQPHQRSVPGTAQPARSSHRDDLAEPDEAGSPGPHASGEAVEGGGDRGRGTGRRFCGRSAADPVRFGNGGVSLRAVRHRGRV